MDASGVVLSQTADEVNKIWVYTVSVNELQGETWQVLEYELFSTGKKVDPKICIRMRLCM